MTDTVIPAETLLSTPAAACQAPWPHNDSLQVVLGQVITRCGFRRFVFQYSRAEGQRKGIVKSDAASIRAWGARRIGR